MRSNGFRTSWESNLASVDRSRLPCGAGNRHGCPTRPFSPIEGPMRSGPSSSRRVRPQSPADDRPRTARPALRDALFYVVRPGGTWRALPADLPHGNTVFGYFQQGHKDGTRDKIEDALRRQLRQSQGREVELSAGVADSQTVRATEQPGPRGDDGGKKNHRRPAARRHGYHRAGGGEWRSRPRPWRTVRVPAWR
jgi:transposase